MKPNVLLIGYGNPLRRDDGVGPHVARLVEGWQVPGVAVRVVQQLVPELASELCQVERALFLDAETGLTEPRVRELMPRGTAPRLGHTGDPGYLLALAETLYGQAPRAWLLTVPAADLDFGEGFSPLAMAGAAAALQWVEAWVR